MPKKPHKTTKRPALSDTIDVMGEILEAVHLRTAIFGRLDRKWASPHESVIWPT